MVSCLGWVVAPGLSCACLAGRASVLSRPRVSQIYSAYVFIHYTGASEPEEGSARGRTSSARQQARTPHSCHTRHHRTTAFSVQRRDKCPSVHRASHTQPRTTLRTAHCSTCRQRRCQPAGVCCQPQHCARVEAAIPRGQGPFTAACRGSVCATAQPGCSSAAPPAACSSRTSAAAAASGSSSGW